jgi:hypothetical protein
MSKKPSKKLVDIVLQSLPNDIPNNIVELWKNNPLRLSSVLRDTLYEYGNTVYFPVNVDYDKTIEELISVGHFSHVNKSFTSENFASTESGKKQITIYLEGRKRQLENDEVKRFPNSHPKSRFATLKEILTLCNTYPTIQNFNRIVALGSQLDNEHPVINGYGDTKEKTLYLDKRGFYDVRDYYDQWQFGTCFALVRVEE